MGLQKDDAAKYAEHFSQYIKAGKGPDDIKGMYEDAHAAILKDASRATVPAEKSTRTSRKSILCRSNSPKLNAINALPTRRFTRPTRCGRTTRMMAMTMMRNQARARAPPRTTNKRLLLFCESVYSGLA